MKTIVLISLFIPLFLGAQYRYFEDTSCYTNQFVAASIEQFSPVPSPIREFAEIQERDTSDLFGLVYYLNRERLLPINNWNLTSFPDHLDQKRIAKLLNNERFQHTLKRDTSAVSHYFYRFYSNNDVRLKNTYGTIIEANGNEQSYENDTIDYCFIWLEELRIHFIRNEAGRNVIKSIGFVALDQYASDVELFWVDFDELIETLLQAGINPSGQFWYKQLLSGDFKGFRYKQDPCDSNMAR